MTAESTLSIVASGMKIIGDVEIAGVLKVDGRIEGSVTSARQVLLGQGASIRGNVVADEVVIGGVLDGSILGAQRLELQSTATVNGDIETKAIVVLEGARINGVVRMSEGKTAKKEARGTGGEAEALRIVSSS